jgi:hypothetical protein
MKYLKYVNLCFVLLLLSLWAVPVQAADPLGIVPFLSAPSDSGAVKIGDSVFVSSNKGDIKVTPHTLYSSGWVTVEFTSKTLQGDVDISFGFNGKDQLQVIKAQEFEAYPHTKVKYTDTIETATFQPKRIIDSKSSYKIPEIGDSNLNLLTADVTYEDELGQIVTKTVAYDSFDGETYSYRYKGQKSETYQTIYSDWKENTNSVVKTKKTFEGAKDWQSVKLSKTTETGNKYTAKFWVEIPFGGESKVEGKYNVVVKPHGGDVDSGIVLDPWYSSSWAYRNQLTCYGSPIAAQTNYQKKYTVYKGAGTDIPERIAEYTTGDDTTDVATYGTSWRGQTFTAETSANVTKVRLKLIKVGSPTSSYACAIRATAAGVPTGANLCSANITSSYVSTTASWYEFDLGIGTALTSGTQYAVIFYGSSATATDYVSMRLDATGPLYTGGNYVYSTNGGSSWLQAATNDYMFQIITTPKIYCAGNCQDDFDDIRFTESDEETLLDHWIESYTSGVSADVWVELDTIAQMTTVDQHTHYYMYYGNTGATSVSSGADTFIRFDDAESGTVAGNGWTESAAANGDIVYSNADFKYGSKSIKITQVSGVTDYYVTNTFTATADTKIVFWVKFSDITQRCRMSNSADGTTWYNGYGFTGGGGSSADLLYWLSVAYIDTGYNLAANWDEYSYSSTAGDDRTVWMQNGVVISQDSTRNAFASLSSFIVMGVASSPEDYYIDAFRVGNYVSPEPLWGTAGTRETLDISITTLGCSGTGQDWAVLNGLVSSALVSSIAEWGFDYGLTTSYGSSYTSTTAIPLGLFTGYISGLSPSTVYHFRAKVFSGSWQYGSDMTFSTEGADVYYDHWTTGGDSDSYRIGSANVTYQTFTTNSTSLTIPHSITKLKLVMKRVGTPGTVTASIRNTSNCTAGVTCFCYPSGEDLTSGTLDGATFSTSYTWYTFTMATETCLSANTTYAIVVKADDCDTSNYVMWQAASAGGYAGGNAGHSEDSGVTWTPQCAVDQLFEIWGQPCFSMLDAKVFTSYIEDGDWLICILYKNLYPPYYGEADDVSQLFYLRLVGTDSTVLAQTKCPEWGYKPACIYLAADEVTGLQWGEEYVVRLYGNFGSYVFTDYVLQSEDWKGSDLSLLDSWVRSAASLMETYYNTDLTTYIAERGICLNSTGGVIFANNIPELDVIRPLLFSITSTNVQLEDEDFTHDYQESLVWQTAVGPQLATAFTNMGNTVGIGGSTVGAFIGFIIYALVALFCFRPGNAIAAICIPLPILLIIFGTGLAELALMGILLAVATLLLANQFWFRGG